MNLRRANSCLFIHVIVVATAPVGHSELLSLVLLTCMSLRSANLIIVRLAGFNFCHEIADGLDLNFIRCFLSKQCTELGVRRLFTKLTTDRMDLPIMLEY